MTNPIIKSVRNLSSIIILWISSSVFAFGQNDKNLPPPKAITNHQQKIENKNHDCIHKNKYNPSQRKSFYPFSDAAFVKIVSFENKADSIGIIETGGNRIPLMNDTVDYSKLDEIKELNDSEVNILTDILYNTGYKGSIKIISEAGCYNPRNAILFVDSYGKTFAYIEVCFECSGYRASSEKVNSGDFCNQKYELLRKLFENIGIKVGVKVDSRVK